MEPVTHVLTGICLARSGFNRRARYATVAMAIAAEFPDIDVLWSLRGPVSSFQHHRGLTHSFLGLPFEAALISGLMYLIYRWRDASDNKRASSVNQNRAPSEWRGGLLYAFTLIALLSHILLDYTNNYGVRPLAPFDPRWFAASIVFIFDPAIFLILLAGLLLPFIFSLVGHEIAGKVEPFRGAGWARAALLAILALWSLRAFEHSKALDVVNAQTLRAPVASATEPRQPSAVGEDTAPAVLRPLLLPHRSLASPDPFSPFRWYTATDYGPAIQLGTVDTLRGGFEPDRVLNKPAPTAALLTAERSHLGQAYLDWSSMPWISVNEGSAGTGTAAASETNVIFQDPRFMNTVPFLHSRNAPPLTGEVILDRAGQVIAQGIDGRFGR